MSKTTTSINAPDHPLVQAGKFLADELPPHMETYWKFRAKKEGKSSIWKMITCTLFVDFGIPVPENVTHWLSSK
jgi:hypothetical protein